MKKNIFLLLNIVSGICFASQQQDSLPAEYVNLVGHENIAIYRSHLEEIAKLHERLSQFTKELCDSQPHNAQSESAAVKEAALAIAARQSQAPLSSAAQIKAGAESGPISSLRCKLGCKLIFSKSNILTQHYKKHSSSEVCKVTAQGKTYYVCTCGKPFAQKQTLTRHINDIHKKIKNHKCPCGKRFAQKSHLNSHQKACKTIDVPVVNADKQN